MKFQFVLLTVLVSYVECSQYTDAPSYIDDFSDPNFFCHRSLHYGVCDRAFSAWHYDPYLDDCRRFQVGECGGNQNRFNNEQDCRAECSTITLRNENTFCNLPPDPAHCSSSSERWYYDLETGKCRKFEYGGCGGNGNRFNSKEECEELCIDVPEPVDLERSELPDCFNHSGRPGVLFSEDCSLHCECFSDSFITCVPTSCYPGFKAGVTEGNDKCTETPIPDRPCCVTVHCEDDNYGDIPVEKPDLCLLPVQPGPCKASFPSFYYDESTDTCKDFIYGGCRGNDNRFDTIRKCENTCKDNLVVDSICDLPPKKGCCSYSFPRWYYDWSAQRCRKFTYSGCKGNDNRFESEEECMKRCPDDHTRPPPYIPKDGEPACFYNCKLFPIGDFLIDCEQRCRCHWDGKVTCYHSVCPSHLVKKGTYKGHPYCSEQEIKGDECCSQPDCRTPYSSDYSIPIIYDRPNFLCLLPPDSGPCKAAFLKYYYDASEGKCLEFTYGGCGGNDNRFDSEDDCEDSCKHVRPADDSSNAPNCTSNNVGIHFSEDCKIHCECFESGENACVNTNCYPYFIAGITEGNPNCHEHPIPNKECCVKVHCEDPNIDSYSTLTGSENDLCYLPAKKGCCEFHFTKWYFDAYSGYCKEFIYSGCNGNANRFNTKKECEKRCYYADSISSVTPYIPTGDEPACFYNCKLYPVGKFRVGCEEWCNCHWDGKVTCEEYKCPDHLVSGPPSVEDHCKIIEIPENECCFKVTCEGCEYHGKTKPVGFVWDTDKCWEYTCLYQDYKYEFDWVWATCQPPKVQRWTEKRPYCEEISIPGDKCCVNIECQTACKHEDYTINEGEKYTKDCYEYTCIFDPKKGYWLEKDYVECPEGSVRPGTTDLDNYCKEVPVEGNECCVKIDCTGYCEYKDVHYDVGEELIVRCWKGICKRYEKYYSSYGNYIYYDFDWEKIECEKPAVRRGSKKLGRYCKEVEIPGDTCCVNIECNGYCKYRGSKFYVGETLDYYCWVGTCIFNEKRYRYDIDWQKRTCEPPQIRRWSEKRDYCEEIPIEGDKCCSNVECERKCVYKDEKFNLGEKYVVDCWEGTCIYNEKDDYYGFDWKLVECESPAVYPWKVDWKDCKAIEYYNDYCCVRVACDHGVW